jgi:hypothetical protein
LKTLARVLASQSFAVAAEVSIRGHKPASDILEQAKELAPFVDAVQVAENPEQRRQISPVAQGAGLRRETYSKS